MRKKGSKGLGDSRSHNYWPGWGADCLPCHPLQTLYWFPALRNRRNKDTFFRSPSPETSWGSPGEADIYVLPLITLADVFQTRSAHDFLTRAQLSLQRKPVPTGRAAQRGVNSGTRACSLPRGPAHTPAANPGWGQIRKFVPRWAQDSYVCKACLPLAASPNPTTANSLFLQMRMLIIVVDLMCIRCGMQFLIKTTFF